MFGALGGFHILENPMLTIPGPEDWSQVRSPSRAARRRRQGHRQNIRQTALPDPNFYVMDDKIICHPAMAVRLRAEAARKVVA